MSQTNLSIISVVITAVGMAERAKEFLSSDAEIYKGNLPEGVKEHDIC